MDTVVRAAVERKEDLALLDEGPEDVKLIVEGEKFDKVPGNLRRLGEVEGKDGVGKGLQEIQAGIVELLNVEEGEIDGFWGEGGGGMRGLGGRR